jgi:prepilin-type N-terminal cleavage/methylation domain-containing protein
MRQLFAKVLNRRIRAFSLIEISIVVLIISILAVGIMQSSRLIKEMKITSARNQTQTSPIPSIRSLVAWFETTSEKSFDESESVSASAITNWYDTNPQSVAATPATQSITANKPTYMIDVGTGLPVVSFDGSGGNATADYLALPDATIPASNSSYTVFLATKLTGDSSIIGSGPESGADAYNSFGNVGTAMVNSWWSGNDTTTVSGAITLNTFQIVSFVYDNTIGKST